MAVSDEASSIYKRFSELFEWLNQNGGCFFNRRQARAIMGIHNVHGQVRKKVLFCGDVEEEGS